MTRRFSILKLQYSQILILILSKFFNKIMQSRNICIRKIQHFAVLLQLLFYSIRQSSVIYDRSSTLYEIKHFRYSKKLLHWIGGTFIRKLSSKLQYQFYRLLCSSPSFKIQSIRLNQTIRTTFYMSRYDSFFSDISISYLIHIKYSY